MAKTDDEFFIRVSGGGSPSIKPMFEAFKIVEIACSFIWITMILHFYDRGCVQRKLPRPLTTAKSWLKFSVAILLMVTALTLASEATLQLLSAIFLLGFVVGADRVRAWANGGGPTEK